MLAVITTIDDADLAASMARELVKRRLAACVQISEIESVFSWEDDVQTDREYRLLIKTIESNYPDVESLLRDMHSYDLPAIFAFDVAAATPDYADWVESTCG